MSNESLREEDIYRVVQEFMRDFGRDASTIRPDAALADLGIDSLGAIDLAFRFEDRFGIVIPMESFPLTTVGEAVRYVLALARARGPSPG